MGVIEYRTQRIECEYSRNRICEHIFVENMCENIRFLLYYLLEPNSSNRFQARMTRFRKW